MKGSVDGVRTAAATVAPTTTKRHCLNICSEETMPVLPSSICMMGTCRMIQILGKASQMHASSIPWLLQHSLQRLSLHCLPRTAQASSGPSFLGVSLS